MTDLVHSLLWKSGQLALSSTYFPQLVRAAAAFHGQLYSAEIVQWVATRPDILNALEVPVGESVDVVLEQYATDPTSAADLDGLILGAVEQYQPSGVPDAPVEP